MSAAETAGSGELAAITGDLALRPRGELDLATAGCLEALLEPFIAAGGTVDVDLGAVTFMDAAVVGVLHGAAAALRGRGVLVVRDPSPQVRRLLDITGLGAVAFVEP